MSLISIIVPCYNQAQYLAECLDSVQAQTCSDWECIIVDDGSPDNTREVVMPYCEKDARFKYLHKENGGLASARNYGIQHSTGEYVLPLDSDDCITADYLLQAIEAFHKNPKLTLVYSYLELFGCEQGVVKDNAYNYDLFLYENQIFCSCIYRRADYDRTAGYDESMRHGYEDWDFLLSLLRKDSQVYQIPQPCFRYRQKQQSMITELTKDNTVLINTLEYIFNKHRDLYTGAHNPLYTYSHIAQAGLLRKRLAFEQERVNRISKSYAFRLGSAIMRPVLWIRKLFIH